MDVLEVLLPQRACGGHLEASDRRRLDEIGERSEVEARLHRLVVVGAREDEEGRSLVGRKTAEEVDAAPIGKPDVGHDQVEPTAGESMPRLVAGRAAATSKPTWVRHRSTSSRTDRSSSTTRTVRPAVSTSSFAVCALAATEVTRMSSAHASERRIACSA